MSHHKPDPNKNVNLTINGLPVTVPEGTTILEAARKINISIPTLCNFPGLGRRAVCRLCVVECDGRGKLMAACANDVYEGAKIVTSNQRLIGIRRTIIELLLNNHPQECLYCVKNKKCELQSLAEMYGIREMPFRRGARDSRPGINENGILKRDMSKCIRCGRCVEVCQEVQTVRAINSAHRSFEYEICTPYGQALADGSCIFCCQCAAVCPVGAIYEFDETANVLAALNDAGNHTAAQVSPAAAPALDGELDLPPGSVTRGQIVTALKLMGFKKVYDAAFFAEISVKELSREFQERLKNRGRQNEKGPGKLPMISGCSSAVRSFINKCYPDLLEHLPFNKTPEQIFRSLVQASGEEAQKVSSVSIVPCITKKFESLRQDINKDDSSFRDYTLSVQELAKMIKTAGIDFTDLPESPFDIFTHNAPEPSSVTSRADTEQILEKVYEGYFSEKPALALRGAQDQKGVKEAELDIDGTGVRVLAVNGLSNARPLLDAIRRGECNADFIEIISCSIKAGCSKGIN